MKINVNEYYNKLKYISLSSIDFQNYNNNNNNNDNNNNNVNYSEMFKYLYPMILINYYKFLVIKELLPESENDHLSIINILIKLTSLSCSPNPSSIFIDSPREHAKFQNNLISPFDWKFCEELIKFFKYSFIIINANDNSIICYKPNYIKEKKYVILKYKSRCDLSLYYKSF